MAESHDDLPRDRATEIAALSASDLARNMADAYDLYVDLDGASGYQGLAYGLDFLLNADTGDLTQRGHDNMALLVTEYRTRISQVAERQTQQEQGSKNG